MLFKKASIAAGITLLSMTAMVAMAAPGAHEGHQGMDHGQGSHAAQMGHNRPGHAGMNHSAEGHGAHGGPTAAGKAGTEAEVDRTVKVRALDAMLFKHPPLSVTAGETVKFEITNAGNIPHEFAIGTEQEHRAHQEMMKDMPNMEHDSPSAVTLAPGETRTLIWTFAKGESIQIACNIPGHYEGGMYSQIGVD